MATTSNATLRPMGDLARSWLRAPASCTWLLSYTKRVRAGVQARIDRPLTEAQAKAWAKRLRLAFPPVSTPSHS